MFVKPIKLVASPKGAVQPVDTSAAHPERKKRKARRSGTEISPVGVLRIWQFIPGLLPIGISSWWAGVKSGKYPPGQLHGPRTRVWKTSDILAIVAHGAEGWK
jgi:hypothetical protein